MIGAWGLMFALALTEMPEHAQYRQLCLAYATLCGFVVHCHGLEQQPWTAARSPMQSHIRVPRVAWQITAFRTHETNPSLRSALAIPLQPFVLALALL